MVISAICCPDKFRGSLTAAEAAAEMAAGLRASGIAATELPLADGGEGTLDVLLAGKGRRLTTRVTGPLGDPVDADWGLLDDGTAVIEMARASGLALVERNDPLRADTRGVGELLLAAARARAPRARSSRSAARASTDGGLGAVEALGWSLPLEVVVRLRRRDALRRRRARFRPAERAPRRSRSRALTERLRALDVPDLPGARRRGRPRRRARRARRHAALGLRRRRRGGRAARAAGSRGPRRHRRGQARRVEPQRQGRRRRAAHARRSPSP